MIRHLYMKNFILIEELSLDFEEGFSAFTGETGAGKSILIDAISLLRADRASASFVMKGCEKAIVEGTFDLKNDKWACSVLEDAGFDVNDETVFTREIYASGKSAARIDHRSVNLSLMKEVLKNQLDIHGQNDGRKLMDEAAPGASYASWAIRFAAGLDGIMAVLSGMSNVEQMVDNLSYMRDFKPLDEREMAVIQQAREILGNARNIPCTACRYCVDGCPRHILIPDVFAAMNKQLVGGQLEEARADYRAAIDAGNFASACIACGRCEDVCPQNIEIISQLRECVTALEP